MNSKFPVKEGRITSNSNLYRNLYHLYNDLYSISSAQNNAKNRLEYYKASQINLLRSTKEEAFSWNKISSLLSLRVSKFYSDFGQNAVKAFFITVFLLGPIFYGLFVLSLENITFDFSEKGRKFFFEEILKYYPQFLNLTHKYTLLENVSSLGNFSLLIDLFSRIFIGIGIFEMIRSFRKYVRK
ncbi:MAG: hypothetical protein ACI9Y7_002373 [Dokdonia sp.]|jgi:hypothetical protein